MEEKAPSQQYLTPSKTLDAFTLWMGTFGTPIRVKYMPALASRRVTNRHSERRNDNWPQSSVTATHSSNRGTIGLRRESFTIIAGRLLFMDRSGMYFPSIEQA
jgi:hypothetical protein